MDRRGLLIAAGALLAAGCARVSPVAVDTPSPTASTAPLLVGADGTPAGALVAQLVCLALVAKGRPSTVTPAGTDWQAALGDGSLAAYPAFGATLWAQLSDDSEPPAGVDALLTDVASLVAPEVSTLAASGVDGGLVWLVTARTAKAGITSLDRIAGWSKGKVAAIPSVAAVRSDGVPGIKGVYGGAFKVATLDDPAQRAAGLASGQVAMAAFRRTEYTGTTDLVALEDPDQLAVTDPLVVLLDSALGDADPEAVLAISELTRILTTGALVDLQAKVAGGATERDAADQWLATNGLA